MKYLTATAILILIWFTAAASNANELYIWQDKRGEKHITQEPPPEGAQTNSVIEYTPQPEEKVKQYEAQQRIEFENQLVEQRRQEALEQTRKIQQDQGQWSTRISADQEPILHTKTDWSLQNNKYCPGNAVIKNLLDMNNPKD